MSVVEAPRDETELLERAKHLAGHTLAELLGWTGANMVAAPNLLHAKGTFGRCVEQCLGVQESNAAGPDFPQLGVEIKTIPIDAKLTPVESTYVCRVPLAHIASLEWVNSPVRKKLMRVLWVPVEADSAVPPLERRVGRGFLWSPTKELESVLESDWQELAGRLGQGDFDGLSAHAGTFLQVRPKAASSRVRSRALGTDGQWQEVLPLGFYLRRSFTSSILHKLDAPADQ